MSSLHETSAGLLTWLLDTSLQVGAFGENTAAARLAIRHLAAEDLGLHADDPAIDGLYEAAKQLQQAADLLLTRPVREAS